MLFTSYGFIAFLCVLFVVYYLLPKKSQWAILLAASYIFYAFAGLDCLVFIFVTTLSAYFVARLMGRLTKKEGAYLDANRETLDKDGRKKYKAAVKKRRFYILVCGLVLNFGILAVIKYSAFAVSNVNTVIGLFGGDGFDIPDLLLPMGISFYIFQTMGYLIDVYRQKTEVEKNPFRLALFVSFFPQLVQGPISRHSDLAPQLYAEHKFDLRGFTYGLQRILWGYFKKLVIADRVLVAVKALMKTPAEGEAEEFAGFYVVLLILIYSVQIYADFTGGIDITIGIAEALGIKLKENFVRPFSSKSTKEYWNRWHITMGTWFTDYIFYPVSVCKPMMKLSKWSRKVFGNNIGKRIPVYLATILTWFLTGLWHGAGWNFIVWGLLNCAVILVSQELEPLYARFRGKFPRLTGSVAYGKFMALRTFLLMGLIRSLDCYRDVGRTFSLWGSMFTKWNIGEVMGEIGSMLTSASGTFLGLKLADYIIIAVGIAAMAVVSSLSAKKSVRERIYDKPVLSWLLCGGLLFAVVMFGAYSIGYDASQFIYNQF
ncbi:MAG: MBOAT family protein [Clostridia bacterium]|nr:MBOAT family protein [Clostridia bacterium]